jgi:hypothetical protein
MQKSLHLTGQSYNSGLIVPPLGDYQAGELATWLDKLDVHRLDAGVVVFHNLRLAAASLNAIPSNSPLEPGGFRGIDEYCEVHECAQCGIAEHEEALDNHYGSRGNVNARF